MTQIFEMTGALLPAADGPGWPKLDADSDAPSDDASGNAQSFDQLIGALDAPMAPPEATPSSADLSDMEKFDVTAEGPTPEATVVPGVRTSDGQLSAAQGASGEVDLPLGPSMAGGRERPPEQDARIWQDPSMAPRTSSTADPSEVAGDDAEIAGRGAGSAPAEETPLAFDRSDIPRGDATSGGPAAPAGLAAGDPAPAALPPAISGSAPHAPEGGEQRIIREAARVDAAPAEGRMAATAPAASVSAVETSPVADGAQRQTKPSVETAQAAPILRDRDAPLPGPAPQAPAAAPAAEPMAPVTFAQAAPGLAQSGRPRELADPSIPTGERSLAQAAPAASGLDPTGSSQQSRAAPGPIGPQTMAALPQQIAVQIARMDSAGGDLVLRLDPPELGQLRIVFSGFEGQVSAQVLADRADVAEQMRRNADLLEQALQDAGFADVDLSFGQGDQMAEDGDSPAQTGLQVSYDLDVETSASGVSPTGAALRDRLDIRV